MEVKSLAEQLLFTTVKVETFHADGARRIATSFVFNFESQGASYLFLVSNKHVVNGAQRGGLLFVQGRDGKPLLGQGFNLEIDNFERIWVGHPDESIDVAVCPLGYLLQKIQERDVKIFFKAVPNALIPTDESLSKLDALEEVVFIGYPRGIWDTKNILPIIRRGITATPVSIDFQGRKQFLIDASVFPGSSGSPVFLYNAGMYHDKGGDVVLGGGRLLFLGVVASVFFQEEESEIRVRSDPVPKTPAVVSRQMVDLGVVFKSATVVEAAQACLRAGGIPSG